MKSEPDGLIFTKEGPVYETVGCDVMVTRRFASSAPEAELRLAASGMETFGHDSVWVVAGKVLNHKRIRRAK